MARDSELVNYNGAGDKTFEITSTSPHARIVNIRKVRIYNDSSEAITLTISKKAESSGGYRVVEKKTVAPEQSANLCRFWPIDDSSDGFKVSWTQAGGDVNLSYVWSSS